MATVSMPVNQVNLGSGDAVTSTLSSAERTGDNTIELSGVSGNSNNTNSDNTTAIRVAAIPRRLEEEDAGKRPVEEEEDTVLSKKSRRSSEEVHRLQANFIMLSKKESSALKLATTRIAKSNELPKGHPDKKSIDNIVKEVNSMYKSSISPKTAGTHVKLGRINTSPLKRGPVGSFPKPILDSLRWAHVSFIQVEQAKGLTQLTIKDM